MLIVVGFSISDVISSAVSILTIESIYTDLQSFSAFCTQQKLPLDSVHLSHRMLLLFDLTIPRQGLYPN